jgi:pseudouridine-5'-phosphate glycosidase/pseudouridine kinase
MLSSSVLASRAAFKSNLLKGARLSRARYHDFAQSKFFKVSEEVRDAVATGKPVVSLETTIYTHGESLHVLGMDMSAQKRGNIG